MKLPNRRKLALAGLFAITLYWTGVARAAERVASPADLLPASVTVYAELSDPLPLVKLALDGECLALLKKSDQVRQGLESPQFRTFQFVLGLIEAKVGAKWDEALKKLSGIAIAHDAASKSNVLFVRSSDAAMLARLNETLLGLIEADAQSKNKPLPQRETHAGVTTYAVGPKLRYAIVDDLLIAADSSETLHALLDRRTAPASERLASLPAFRDASSGGAGQIGFAYGQLDAVKQLPKVAEALGLPSTKPAVEYLFGGVLETLAAAPTVTARLTHTDSAWRLAVSLPRDAGKAAAERQWYFSPSGEGAPAVLALDGLLGAFTLYRDDAGFWSAKDKLFGEEVQTKFAQAETGLGLVFGSKNFGEDFLSRLDPRAQLVVTRQSFGEGPVPAAKLPAFAVILGLKEPEKAGTQLLVTYQKLVGIANFGLAQQSQPQLLLGMAQHEGVTLTTAKYLKDENAPQDAAPVHYNFSPSVAQVGKHFVIGSSVDITKQVVAALQKPAAAAPSEANTRLVIDLRQLGEALADNREFLVARNMLEEGKTRDEADANIGLLLDVLSRLPQAELKLVTGEKSLELSFQLGK